MSPVKLSLEELKAQLEANKESLVKLEEDIEKACEDEDFDKAEEL